MLSDIEIAKQAKMLKIGEVAAKLGISEDEYEPYGHYKAKLSESLYALSLIHISSPRDS